MYFGSNIRFLRKRRKLTQAEVAGAVKLKRPTLNNYENGISGPSVQALLDLSDFFRIAVDSLLRVDLSSLRESQLYELEQGQDVFLKGRNIRVLATTVDRHNRENIELVSQKAKAGYLSGFSDPEYISELPVFQLPFLSGEKKYRTFQLNGDSMLPIPDGAWVTGEFVQDWTSVKDGEKYVLLTMNEGIVFKQVRNMISQEGCLELISTNTFYAPYKLPVGEIREVWKFVHYISNEVPDTGNSPFYLAGQIDRIKNDLEELKDRMTGIKK